MTRNLDGRPAAHGPEVGDAPLAGAADASRIDARRLGDEPAAPRTGESDEQHTDPRLGYFELVTAPYRALETRTRFCSTSPSAPSIDRERDRIVGEALARCEALEPVGLDELIDLLATAPPAHAPEVEAIEHRSAVPWLLAIGESKQARRWSARDPARGGRRLGDWRDCQADLAELQVGLAEGRPAPAIGESPSLAALTVPVQWYRLHADIYWQLIRGNITAARLTLGRISELAAAVPPPDRGELRSLQILCETVEGASGIELSVPRADLPLRDLRSALVGAEAVAASGTRPEAARWDRWFEDHWPSHMLRDPSWPVLASRMRALLACRAGDIDAGKLRMAEAIVVADRIESPVEAALSRIQYAELLALDPQWGARDRWALLVQQGREGCRELGIPYEHHAHRARTAAVLGRFDSMSSAPSAGEVTTPPLTGREIEVLRLFSAGHSYRQAAAVLGVGWRTVQSHAYNAYQKLGVSSKIAAVAAARRLHLL